VRAELERYRGREIDNAGDGFCASFDGPARAIRCALAIREDLHRIGLDVRAGIHTGECEVLHDKLAGVAIHAAARIAASGGRGDVRVSGTVRDLVAGSGIAFQNLGPAELKGLPGVWQLLKVTS
jgi:class 3 adenylate cyclase